VTSVYTELALTSLAAMLSPTTLSFSVFALVLGDRPLRTGVLFYLGAFGVTIVIGIAGAFVLGNVAASSTSDTPKTWVAVVDVLAGVFLLAFVLRRSRQPLNPEKAAGMIDQMSKVASSPWIAIVAAGATLANPGGFIPLALKQISELNPNAGQYILLWLAFTVMSLLPLLLAIVMLAVRPEPTKRLLHRVRGWLERHARTLAFVILVLLAAALLRNGIAGLTA
jgi:uncharacterized membrane protein